MSEPMEAEAPEERRRRAMVDDPELIAMSECQRSLDALDDEDGQNRVLCWLFQKYGVEVTTRVQLSDDNRLRNLGQTDKADPDDRR